MLFLAFGQADFKFDASAHEMQIKRYEGIAGAFNLADQFCNLPRMQKQFSGPYRVVMIMRRG